MRATAADEPLKGEEGVAPGAFQWPPKPITEHGEPLPEDDPTKPEGCALLPAGLGEGCRCGRASMADPRLGV